MLPARSSSAHAGVQLQELPLEIIQSISRRFSAAEWARGPVQTCHLLSEMHLPRIALDPDERVSALYMGLIGLMILCTLPNDCMSMSSLRLSVCPCAGAVSS